MNKFNRESVFMVSAIFAVLIFMIGLISVVAPLIQNQISKGESLGMSFVSVFGLIGLFVGVIFLSISFIGITLIKLNKN